MYVNNFTNRNEFLEKFKQDHLNERNNYSETNANNLNNSKLKKNDKNGNNFSNMLKKSGIDGRWDYLYQLEKLKRSKLKEKREIKENQLFEKDLIECTFSPKLNKVKNIKNNFNSKSNFMSTSLEKDHSKNPLPTDENLNSKIYSGNLLERQQWWEYKKKLKIENLRHNEITKNVKECVFQPKLNRPDTLKKVEIDQEATNLLVDPESYFSFVNRRQKFREEKENLHRRQKSTPGCGRIWTNKITKPAEFNIKNDQSDNQGNIHVKSLEKPITHGKFLNIKSNYRAGDNKEINKKNISDFVYTKKDDELFVDRNKPKLKFQEKVDYAEAMRQLHVELYSIDLFSEEY